MATRFVSHSHEVYVFAQNVLVLNEYITTGILHHDW